MEQKTVSGKIPAELHARFRSEMEARGWTMSFALEQVINEHFENEKGRNNTMENTRTLAFAVSEEFFQLVKEYLAWYEEVYHRRLTQKQFIIGLIEDELERNAEAMKARRTRQLSEQQAREDVLRLAEQYEAVSTDESDNEYREEAAEDEAETEYGEEAAEGEAESEYGEEAAEDEAETEYGEEAAEDEAETEYREEVTEDEAETEYREEVTEDEEENEYGEETAEDEMESEDIEDAAEE